MEKLYTADKDQILKTLSPVNLTSKSLAILDSNIGLAKYGKHNPARDIYRGYNNMTILPENKSNYFGKKVFENEELKKAYVVSSIDMTLN
jgi:hypothetical protein